MRCRRSRSAETRKILKAIEAWECADAPGRKWFARERWPEVQTQSSLCGEAAFSSRTRWALGGGGFRVAMQSAAE